METCTHLISSTKIAEIKSREHQDMLDTHKLAHEIRKGKKHEQIQNKSE